MTAVLETPAPSVRPEVRSPGLGRLTLVELRKLADTRAGLWLLIIIALATVGTSAILIGWAPDEEQNLEGFFGLALLPSAVLLPVLGILSMTAEWSQRTALTTFTLVPARERVIVAKLAAGVLIALLSTVAMMVIALAATALAGVLGGDGGFDIPGSLIWQGAAMQVVFILMGLAFGALLLNSPLAIVLYLALPMVWGILGGTISALADASRWLDINTTTSAMTEAGMTGGEWARVGVSAAVWVLLPLVVGVVRVLRREVN
ncbi:ABC transporter permease [Paractinoplanes lichenicola]|uniref:ABC transporter permease n=1 Tax=Paractinoplanes lichenicola TaxID=2802976 RepID=A0ABS1W4G6_9ACTN|nr:ABC transporter permease [Actinoplanes lichenicola]MBL7261645.1 ABC transporter permease [Actinoplanes lichenicola]